MTKEHGHMALIALAVGLILDSFRVDGAKASLPVLGRVPTFISGPPPGQGLLAGFMGAAGNAAGAAPAGA